MAATTQRPLGLVSVAVVAVVFGVIGVISNFMALFAGTLFGILFFLAVLVGFALSICELVVGYGVWTLQPWGLRFAELVFALGIAVTVLSLIVLPIAGLPVGAAEIILSLVWIGAYAAMLRYLSLPHVRDLFRAPAHAG